MSKYVGFRLGKVHESHVISEYYCGGCGWPVTDHDSFCPECGGAFRECDASDLDEENAKLREERDGWKKLCTDQEIMHVMREETLDNENERLRQLVRDMRTCIDHACMCEFCPLFITSEDMDEPRCIADMKAHMRELGVDE